MHNRKRGCDSVAPDLALRATIGPSKPAGPGVIRRVPSTTTRIDHDDPTGSATPRHPQHARARLSRLPRPRRVGQVAAAPRLRRHRASASNPRWAAATGCPSPTSPLVTATASAANISARTPTRSCAYTAAFDDPNLPGQMQTTVVIREVFCGVEPTSFRKASPP